MGEFGTRMGAQNRPPKGRPRPACVQGKRRTAARLAAMPAGLALALAVGGCAQNPILTPVAWWHDLQGGAIAADRPPPPGADQPYPHIYSIPPKPVLPSTNLRDTIQTQLAQERDDTERQATHNPIVVAAVPAPPPPLPPPAPGTEGTTANATLPAAEPPPPQPNAAPADGGPPPGAPLVIAGVPADEANLPNVPDAPPAPATFEGIPALPAPTPAPPLPPRQAGAQGSAIFFRPTDAVLDTSQTITIKDAAAHRGRGSIEVEGHGDAQSDSPAAQEAALDLALKRAQAVAAALEAQRVPGQAIHVAATAFGRGAAVRDVP